MLTVFFGLIVVALIIIGQWKAFKKAGYEGWKTLISGYNSAIMCQIGKIPEWWVLLLMVPIANIVALFNISIKFAKGFGKSTGFGVGLVLLPYIFYPILGFGKATCADPTGPLAGNNASQAPVQPQQQIPVQPQPPMV